MTNTSHPPLSLPLLTTLAAATLTASLGISIASVLLPTLSRTFSATVSDVQWTVLAYLMSVTISIVSAGRLGDLFGHSRMLIAGLIIFIIASIICATAPNLGLLIAGRALQGLGGAILIALPMSIARDIITTERLGTAMGLLGTISAVGTTLGPSLGGLLLVWGDWSMAFYLLAGFGTLTLILAIAFIDHEPVQKKTSIKEMDFLGTVLLAIALAAYALATSGGAANIPFGPNILIPCALITIMLFVLVETRVTSPLVPMHFLKNRKTCSGFAMNLLIGTIMMSTLVIGPFFLTFSLGLNEAVIGLIMSVGPITAALSGVPAGHLTDRFGARRVMLVGIVQTVLGLLCLAFLPRFFGVGGYIASLVMLTPAFQLFLAANNTTVLADAPKEQRGRLSGLLGLSRNLGLMTGTSAMSTLFTTFIGTGEIAHVSRHAVSQAFSMTFVVAAGLGLITIALAIYSQQIKIPVKTP